MEEERFARSKVVSDNIALERETVVARVTSAQEQSINLRLVPGKGFLDMKLKACRPRGNTPQSGFDSKLGGLAIPSGLVTKFKDANQRVIRWIAASDNNARLFVKDPTAALKEAGVELTRAEAKAIARAREELSDGAAIPPGMIVRDIRATAYPNGEVGKVGKGDKSGKAGKAGKVGAQPEPRPGRPAKRGCVKE